MRLQLSMLLLPMTTRANFCAMKFISFVDLEQLNRPKDVPLWLLKPLAARSSASSQLAGRSEPLSPLSVLLRTIGCVNRL